MGTIPTSIWISSISGLKLQDNFYWVKSHKNFATIGALSKALTMYIIRGDNVAIISELDEVRDSEIDITTIRADPIKPLQQNVLR